MRRNGNEGEPAQVLIRMPKDLKTQYELLKLQRKVSLNDVFVAALELFVSPEDADKGKAALEHRMEKIDRHLSALEKRQEVTAETLALFVQIFLTNTPEVPEDRRNAASQRGGRRWQRFVDIVSGRLETGQSFFTDLPQAIVKAQDFGRPADLQTLTETLVGEEEQLTEDEEQQYG